MYISLNWIKDFVDLDGIDPNKLINQFTLSCAEVEGMEEKGKNLSGVVVGKILSVENHPNSHKLHLLKVDVGNKVLDIVCGAPNVRVGLVVPVAVEGANVCGTIISKAKVGGYDSYGMCCSASELGISADNSGLMELDDTFIIGKDIKEQLEIEDIVFEVDNKSLTNRPDMWGHYGIAREIAAITGRKLKRLPVCDISQYDNLPSCDIKVTSKSCYRYCGMKVENITKVHSPYNMQIRLFYAGMRGINLLADLTNYLMLELGQPMHAFDGAKVDKIVVRDIDKDTMFTTLDDTERLLPKGTMVIDNGDEISAIAGVMGGLDSEIETGTNSLFLESANFDGTKVRKTATSLGLRTEASARYEKMLDPNMCDLAIARFVYLLKQIDSNIKVVSKCTDVYVKKYPHIDIEITKQFIDKYVGIDIPTKQIVDILKSLEFGVNVNGDKMTVSVPSFRATKDISCRPDIVEEITRVYGYDKITPKSTLEPVEPVKQNNDIIYDYDVKYALATRYNMSEVHTYIWYDNATNNLLNIDAKSYVHIINGISKDNNDIRSSMVPSLLKVLYDNQKTYRDVGVFEIGHVAVGLDQNKNVVEEKHLGIVLGSKDNDTQSLLLKVKDAVLYLFDYVITQKISLKVADRQNEYEHPVNYYDILLNNEVVGHIGTVHPNVVKAFDKGWSISFAEINMNKIYEYDRQFAKFEKVSKFPTTTLDFNLVLENGRHFSEIESVANGLDTDLKYHFSLVDVYDNVENNTKSYTIRFLVTSHTHTLSSTEIEKFHTLVINSFAKNNISLKA